MRRIGWYRMCVRRSLNLLALLAMIGAAFAPGGRTPAKVKPVTWTVIKDALFRVNDAPVKDWNIYQPGKKGDPLLLQLGDRFLLIEVHDHQVFEIDPSRIEHKSDELLWDPADHPAHALPTSGWNEGDVGTAFRIETKMNADNRVLVLELPHPPDIGALPVLSQSPTQRRGRR